MCVISDAVRLRSESISSAATIPFDYAWWRPRHNPWLVAFTVTLATFMEVLDTSIANIALPHIAGSFGASTNESTWVLTSYLVSNGIVLPISAWLATRLGRKKFYMACVVLFASSSFMCGLAPSLGVLVFSVSKARAAEDCSRVSRQFSQTRFRQLSVAWHFRSTPWPWC